MTYCNKGDNPKVKYKFGVGGWQTFKTKFSPINIETKSVPVKNTNNYQPKGFLIENWTAGVNTSKGSRIVLDYEIFNIPIYPEGQNYTLSYQDCNGNWQVVSNCYETNTPYRYSKCRAGYPIYPPQIIKIDRNINCPENQQKKERCSLIIRFGSVIIHEVQGECPVEFSVQCGKCEEGEVECKTDHYPGYCCHDCEELANQIRNIRRKLIS